MPGFKSQEDSQRKLQEQINGLRQHCKMERMRMSKTIAEMVDYCTSSEHDDPLIHPVKENPFKEKKSCNIL